MMAMLNRSATTAKISGESGHPCLVPELMWYVLLESTPLTLILAFTWSFLYTVCTSSESGCCSHTRQKFVNQSFTNRVLKLRCSVISLPCVQLPEALEAGAVPPLQFLDLNAAPAHSEFRGCAARAWWKDMQALPTGLPGLVAGPRLTRHSLFAPKPKRKGLLFDPISEQRTVVSCLQEGAIPGC